ncbi:MAG: SH3 domain-containing protein [Leptospiraceae bacterium]|nr:SH3 domain-containing protein [Leptospiraceae bacterium]
MRTYLGMMIIFFFLFCGKEKEQTPASIPANDNTANSNLKEQEVVPLPQKSLTLGPHIVNAPSGLMLRAEPSKNGTVIVKMLNGMRADVLEYSQNEDIFEGNRARWAKVKYKKYTGWAFSYYLKPEKGAKSISE